MRCLYCGEPLSLLRKLTGKAEFCSDAHREAYQDEFNSLALERLAAQPSQKRRENPKFVAPLDLTPPAPSEEPFAGLPFPEDPDDFEDALPVPTLSESVSTAGFVPAENPAAGFVAAPEPPMVWGWMPGDPPVPAGAVPPSYSFPLWLADYPRSFLMMNGVEWHANLGEVPYGAYVDLPELQDDTEGTTVRGDAKPLHAPLALRYWEAPLEVWPTDGELRAQTSLAALTFAQPVQPASETSLTHCGVGTPERLASELSSPRAAVLGISATRPDSPPLAHAAWVGNSGVEVGARPHDSEPTVVYAEREPWNGLTSAMAAPVSRVSAPDGALPYADAVAAPPWESALPQEWTLLGSAAPECELFDAECSLIAPQVSLATSPTVPRGELLALDLRLAGVEAGRVSASPGTRALGTGTSSGQLPFAPTTGGWNPPQRPHALEISIPEAKNLQRLPFDLPSPMAPGESVPMTRPEVLPLRGASPLPSALRRPTDSSAEEAILPEAELIAWTDQFTAPLSLAGGEPAANLEREPAAVEEPVAWLAAKVLIAPRSISHGSAALSRSRVKDFRWPDFAAGCESLSTPDQPFRFHEVPFPARGITEASLGDALKSEILQGLRLVYRDDRFDGILHPGFDQAQADLWLNEATMGSASQPRGPVSGPTAFPFPATSMPSASPSGNLPPGTFDRAANDPGARDPGAHDPGAHDSGARPQAPAARPPVVSAFPSSSSSGSSGKPGSPSPTGDAPNPWQQAARAMYEGEQQQISREAHPVPPPKPTAPPVADAPPRPTAPVVPEPLNGMELTHPPRPEPPVPFGKTDPVDSKRHDRSPANEDPQFDWRREPPRQAPPPPPSGGSSTVSVNTTVTVEGNANGVVVENAVRISLGNQGQQKKSGSGLEKFTEGEDLSESGLEIAPPEGLPDFVPTAPELRAMLEPIPPVPDSIQWPKFSVMPMRRRIAFGPPNRNLFGGLNSAPATKAPPAESKPLPPQKTVGFLFRRLTKS